MALTSTESGPAPAARLVVTGGSGFLGRLVVANAAGAGWDVVAPTSGQLDLRDRSTVLQAMEQWCPHAIVHTAYRKDRASIVDTTRHVAAAAHEVGARLVHVSTDALFAGRPEPYRERDAPDPVHDYGRWKHEAEQIVLDSVDDTVVVRTSLLYARASVSPHDIAVRAAVDGTSDIAFFTDEFRSAVFADDLARALVELASRADVCGVLHLAGPRALSRAELARISCERWGWDASRLRFAETGRFDRPTRVVLDSTRAAQLGWAADGPG